MGQSAVRLFLIILLSGLIESWEGVFLSRENAVETAQAILGMFVSVWAYPVAHGYGAEVVFGSGTLVKQC